MCIRNWKFSFRQRKYPALVGDLTGMLDITAKMIVLKKIRRKKYWKEFLPNIIGHTTI